MPSASRSRDCRYPFPHNPSNPNLSNCVIVILLQFLITFFGIGLLHGLAPILTSESFPTKYRYSGTGISYSLSAILGGMVAPSLLAGLIGQDAAGKWYFVPVVYAIYCAVAMLSLLFVRETRDVPLEELDREEILAEPARSS
jgi:MFS family permease